MSLFSNLGEKVERFKQKAVDASEEQAEFACRVCEEPVYTDQETCPHCGADAVVRIRTEDATENAAGGDGPPEDGGGEPEAEAESGPEPRDTPDEQDRR